MHSTVPIPPGLFEVGSAWGVRRKVPAAHNSETINDNAMKFDGVAENYKLILIFNWLMTSSLRYNDVITAKIFSSYKNPTNQSRKVWRSF